MELRQRLTRWQTRVRNFHWGRQNKQLLTGSTVADAETTDSNSTQFRETKRLASKFRRPDEDTGSQPETGRGASNPMKRILRQSKAEYLVEPEEKSPSPAADSRLNPSSILNKNGTKLPRYAKLTNLTVPEQSTHNINHHHPLPNHHHLNNHNHQSSSIQPLKQKKAKIVSPKWNKITHALCNSNRLKVSKMPRLMSSGEASWHEEEEKREEFHTYAFDNAALDLRNPTSEKPVT